MNRQLILFEGYGEHPELSEIDYCFTDEELEGIEGYPAPQVDIDFDASPDVPRLHAAFATKSRITLVTQQGEQLGFLLEEDLDYRGWLDDVTIGPGGDVDVTKAPNFAFYEGHFLDEQGNTRGDPWIILIDPETGPDKVLEKIFFWNGDPLALA